MGKSEILLLSRHRSSAFLTLVMHACEQTDLLEVYMIARGTEWMCCTGGESGPAGAEISVSEQHTGG